MARPTRARTRRWSPLPRQTRFGRNHQARTSPRSPHLHQHLRLHLHLSKRNPRLKLRRLPRQLPRQWWKVRRQSLRHRFRLRPHLPKQKRSPHWFRSSPRHHLSGSSISALARIRAAAPTHNGLGCQTRTVGGRELLPARCAGCTADRCGWSLPFTACSGRTWREPGSVFQARYGSTTGMRRSSEVAPQCRIPPGGCSRAARFCG